MGDSDNASPANGDQPSRMLDQTSNNRPPLNENSMRTGERTCTQNLSIPTLEKHDSSSANLWWRKIVQYVKKTKDFDISSMVNSKETLPQYREKLETEIKDIFLWAIGQNALTEMTKTVKERKPSFLPLHKLNTLFRLHYTPEQNVEHNRSDFFDLKRDNRESAADVWKRILEIEKNCEFENTTAAELLASKFLSLMGKSTRDYELKNKIRKSDMSVEAITDAIHEYMYKKLNDSSKPTNKRKLGT